MGSIFVSERACGPLKKALAQTGHDVYEVCSSDVVYDAISSHPDIYMCRIKNVLVIDDSIVMKPNLKERYMEELIKKSDDISAKPIIPLMKTDGDESWIVFEMGGIGYEYPDDVAYNAVSTDRFFIHNTELTSPQLLDRARNAGLNIISVRQGYTKCSCVVVGERAVITSDEGICRVLEAWNKMVLKEIKEEYDERKILYGNNEDEKNLNRIDENGDGLIQKILNGKNSGTESKHDETETADETIDFLLVRKGYVALDGFEYGFLGGASGCIDDTVYFNGDLSAHPDYEKIRRFIEAHGLRVKFFADEPLTDIGSIIFLP